MASPAQITANRENAQHSTGPVTAAGKQKVAMNRITHGLTGAAILIPGEDPEQLQALAVRLNLELAPGTAVEESLVKSIANLQWRLDRVASWIGQLSSEALDAGPAAPSRLMRMFSKTANPCDALERLHRHEASLRRQHLRALKELRTSKDERSKILAGKNPAAYADIVETVERARAALAAHGMVIRENDNSNPIPDSLQSLSASGAPAVAPAPPLDPAL
jgi:hypothetical protein